MRAAFISFILTAVVAWFIVGAFLPNADKRSLEERAALERISLLGNSTASPNASQDFTSLDSFETIQEVLARLESSTPFELKRWLLSLCESPRSSNAIKRLIVSRLASEDPEGTYSFLRANEKTLSRDPHLLVIALTEWTQRDLPAAIDVSLKESAVFANLFRALSKLKPERIEAAYAYLLEKGADKTSIMFGIIFRAMAEYDPEMATHRAIEFTLSIPEGDLAGMGEGIWINSVMAEWYNQDPDAASQWAIEHVDPKARKLALNALTSMSLREEGVEGIARFWDLLDEQQRLTLAEDVRSYRGDIGDMIDWVNSHVESPAQHQAMLTGLLGAIRYGNDRPEQVVEILSHMEGEFKGDQLSDHVRSAALQWAHKDLSAMQSWVDSLENPAIRQAAQNGIWDYWMEQEPEEAIAYWKQNADQWEAYSATIDLTDYTTSAPLRNLVNQLVKDSQDRSPHELMDKLPEEWHDLALSIYVDRFARTAPEKIIRFLEMQPESELRERSIQSASAHWARNNPSQAAEWLAEQPEGSQSEITAHNIANAWTHSDPDAALEWVEDLPPSTSRDVAAQQVSEIILQHRPVEALKTANTIADPEFRDIVIEQTLSQMARRNPDLATEYVHAAGLGNRWITVINEERALLESLRP